MRRPTVSFSKKALFVSALVVTLAAVGVVGVRAAIPDASGDVHACYKSSSGSLRVIDNATQQCTGQEGALSWTALHRIANNYTVPLGSIPPDNPRVSLTVPQFGDLLLTCDANNATLKFHNTSSNTVYSQYESIAPGGYSDTAITGEFFIGSGAQTRVADISAWVGAQGDPINVCYFQGRALY